MASALFGPKRPLPSDEKWTQYRARRANPRLRMFCLPWAGGNSGGYVAFSGLPEDIDIVCVELPGRLTRHSEPCLTTLGGMAEGAVGALYRLGVLDELPFVLYGHSMGAKVVYEMTRIMESIGYTPQMVVVSGSLPPQLHSMPVLMQALSTLPREQLISVLVSKGGIPEQFKDSPVMDLFLPAIRADYGALEVYEHIDPSKKMTCALVALGGEEDTITENEIKAWGEMTEGSFEYYMCDGGHFFVKDLPDDVKMILEEKLSHV